MRNLLGLSFLLFFATSTANLNAQDTGFFNGNGVKNSWGSSSSSSGSESSGPFGFHRGAAAAEPGESLGFQFPKLNLPKFNLPKLEMPKFFEGRNFPNPIQLSDSNGGGLFANLPKFELPTRDPNQPNFFQRMNERTRDLFGRTRDGLNKTTNHVLGADEAARETWDNITKGINGDIGGSGNRNQPPIQPRLRSARQSDGSTAKF